MPTKTPKAKASPAPKGNGQAETKAKHADGALSAADLKRYHRAFDADPRFRQSMNAVTTTPVNKVAVNRRKVALIDHSFSLHLPENKATAQMSSGRCWLFAALNTFRVKAIESMKLKEEFELSQAYVCFWDKLEKANYFLENVLATLDEPVGSRVLDYLLAGPIQDGGQWHMFLNLIQKYGVVPKSVMPETDSSSNTGMMNHWVTGRLREMARELREASRECGSGEVGKDGGQETKGRRDKGTKGHRNKAGGLLENGSLHTSTLPHLRTLKDQMMSEIYRMLCIHLGEPPTEFHWQWRDKDKNFHRPGKMTPQQFYKKYVGVDLDDLVCLIHDPRPMHEYNRAYTVKYLGNVVGGTPVLYLNVSLETMKRAAIKQIEDGEPVWFGCDVGKFLDRDSGVMGPELFEYDLVYGWNKGDVMDKAGRLMYGHSAMNHAMVFTGVNVDEDGESTKWRIENSWSDKPGDKGFFQMSDAWFDEYNFETVVRKKYVPKKSLDALKEKPIELPPWDPMGSLA